eukprot:4302436-Alexandrium_andersonii.AAC.1
MNGGSMGSEGREHAQVRTPIRNPPIRNMRNPWLSALESPTLVPSGTSWDRVFTRRACGNIEL